MRMAKVTLLAVLVLMLGVGSAVAQEWYARGSYYVASDELGAAGEWGCDSGNFLLDDGTNGDAVAGDGIFSRLVTATVVAGDYQFKVGSLDWSEGYPMANVPITLDVDNAAVLVTIDTNFYDDGFWPQSHIVWSDHLFQATTGWYVVGSAPEIGEWDPIASVLGTETTGGLIRAEVSFETADLYYYKWIADQTWGPEAAGEGFTVSTMANLAFEPPTGGYVFVLNPVNGRVKTGPLGTVPVVDRSWGQLKALYDK